MAEPLTLMAVHAHPDDEASGGGILATYSDQGIRTIVVTCTNGEFGDAPGGIKPGQDGHDAQEVAQLRLSELRQSVKILGVAHLETLGYRDSGMAEWEYKDDPGAFCNTPLAEVADRIGELITKYRPQVLVSYDDQGAYQHPDHVHASRAAQAAAAQTGIPAKVYLSTMRGSSWRKIWEALRELGADVPSFPEDPERERRARESEQRITTTIDIRQALSRKREALFAHGSQINDSWFSKLPPEIAEEAFGYEYFIRIADSTGAPRPETDLFAGLRTGELPGREQRRDPAWRASTGHQHRRECGRRALRRRSRAVHRAPQGPRGSRPCGRRPGNGPADRRAPQAHAGRVGRQPPGPDGPGRARQAGRPRRGPAGGRAVARWPPAARGIRTPRRADRRPHRPGVRGGRHP